MSRKIIAILLSALAFIALFAFVSFADGDAAETQVADSDAADAPVVKTVTVYLLGEDGLETAVVEEDGYVSVSADDASVKTTGEESAAAERPIWLVIVMGVGVVFFGLVCIVILSMLMSAIVRAGEKKIAKDTPVPAPAPADGAENELTPEKRRELIAAISAVVAEELGADVSAIRVTSFKKL